MPDVSQILRLLVMERGIQLEILEKDYALSYLLAAIAETPGLGDKIALKGGTALRKLYYPNHRFSEDLDFSTIDLRPAIDFDKTMSRAILRMTTLLHERGPFSVQFEPMLLRLPHSGQQAAYLVRVQFPYQRQPLCRLKVEFTVDEPIFQPIEHRSVLHGYDEALSSITGVYTLEEIVSEKLRALLQSRNKLADRGWGAGRICRDYYDLWFVLAREGHLSGQIPDLVSRKCAVRGVKMVSPMDFIPRHLLDVARKEWQGQLLPFVPMAPQAEKVLTEVQALILNLWEQPI